MVVAEGWVEKKKNEGKKKGGMGEEEGRELAFQLKLAARPLPARTLASPGEPELFFVLSNVLRTDPLFASAFSSLST